LVWKYLSYIWLKKDEERRIAVVLVYKIWGLHSFKFISRWSKTSIVIFYIYIYEKKTFYVAIKCCTICENSDILFSHTSSWKSNSLWWQLSLFCARNGHFIDPWPQKRVADIYLIKSHNDQWELLIRSPLGFTWPFSSEVWRVLANILIIKQKFMHIYIYIVSFSINFFLYVVNSASSSLLFSLFFF